MVKKKKNNWGIILRVLIYLAFVAVGVIIGMILQQMIFTASAVEIARGLEGTTFNVEVNLNETQLIEEFKESFIPVFNQTMQENRCDCWNSPWGEGCICNASLGENNG